MRLMDLLKSPFRILLSPAVILASRVVKDLTVTSSSQFETFSMSASHRRVSSGLPDAPVISSLNSCLQARNFAGEGRLANVSVSASFILLCRFFFLAFSASDELSELEFDPESSLMVAQVCLGGESSGSGQMLCLGVLIFTV